MGSSYNLCICAQNSEIKKNVLSIFSLNKIKKSDSFRDLEIDENDDSIKNRIKNNLKNLDSLSTGKYIESKKIHYESKKDNYTIKISYIENIKEKVSRHPSDNLLIHQGNTKKVLIYGEKESGKTSFVLKICDNKFDQFYVPSIFDEIFYKTILFIHCNKKYDINFIVSNNITEIMEADCYIVLYDLTSINSYNKGKNLINKISNLNKPIFFIGNKCDLSDEIITNDLTIFCEKNKCEYYQISLKNNIGIPSFLHKFGEILTIN